MINHPVSSRRFEGGWRIAGIFTSAFLILALAYSISATPIYQASARFLVYPNANLTSSRDVVSSLDTLDKKTISSTYADILGSNRVYLDTINRLNLTSAQLKDVKVYAQVQTNTNILVLNVEGQDPEITTLLANNIGQNGISYIKSIYQVFDISFLDRAVTPEKPIRPRPLIYGLIGTGIGLAAGLIFLLLREWLRVPLDALRERSVTDKQSLAYTRKYMLRVLAYEANHNKDNPLAFGLIRLEGMEDLVDGLPGHITTMVMQNVVKQLHDLLRGNDLVARWDKLTFSVMLPNTQEEPAQKTFRRLLQALETDVELEEGEMTSLLPAAGLAICVPDETTEQIIQRANQALESAVENGSRIAVLK